MTGPTDDRTERPEAGTATAEPSFVGADFAAGDDIAALVPVPVALRLGAETVKIHPVTLTGLRAFRRLAALAAEALAEDDVLAALAERDAALTGALAAATGIAEDRFREAPLDHLFLALCATLRVNADFFAGPVSRAIAEGTGMLMRRPADGAPSSPG